VQPGRIRSPAPGHSTGDRAATASCPNQVRRRRRSSTVKPMRRLLVLLAALCVVAGCSTSVAGTPFPEASAAGGNPGAPNLSLPPRPHELRLDGLDPCSSLSSPQLAKLALEIISASKPTSPSVGKGRICTADGFDSKKTSVSIAFVYNRGIATANTGPGAASSQITPSNTAGFPSIVARLPDFCAVDIDVAADQYIDIQYETIGDPLGPASSDSCQGAALVGEEVMSSLQHR
jgi:uncharacterized protein DUF3558